jgi:integrase
MPGASKRPDGRWRIWYTDERGKRRFAKGHGDKKSSLILAEELERQARRVREGLAEPGEKTRKAAASVPLADHAADWRLQLLAKGGTPGHCRHQTSSAAKLLKASGAEYPEDITPGAVRLTLGRMRAAGRSPRTCNHALGAVKAFAKWLVNANRLREVPRGLADLEAYGEEVDRRRVRRALTGAELEALILATEDADPIHIYGHTKSKHHRTAITGADRAMIYRVAMGTGFRAAELRSLRREWFDLGAEDPCIRIPAEFTKNRKGVDQPIRRDLAEALAPYLERRHPGAPALPVPDRTSDMLRADLERAGIPYRDGAGRVIDFHALRASYITNLIQSGADVKTAQMLARHSNPSLTISRYTHTDDARKRDALENMAHRRHTPGASKRIDGAEKTHKPDDPDKPTENDPEPGPQGSP